MSRSIFIIARDIREDWKKISPHALPYLQAMEIIDDIDGAYVFDSARDVVTRFLCNASSWRGDKARQIKAELKALCS